MIWVAAIVRGRIMLRNLFIENDSDGDSDVFIPIDIDDELSDAQKALDNIYYYVSQFFIFMIF